MKTTWKIKVLYDGDCPLCSREVRFLEKRNSRSHLAFEDIAEASFDPSRYGLTREAAMGQIHGVLPSGEVVRGMEVFRRAYAGIGWGWLLAPSRWRLLAPLFDRAYAIFARKPTALDGTSGMSRGRHVRPSTRHMSGERSA